jgi:hypothetical protein
LVPGELVIGGRWGRAIAGAAAIALVVLALFLAHPLAEGFRLPIGPDGPVYTWWARLAEVAGLETLPGRPGVPGAILVLGSTFGIETVEAVALVGPVLAVVLALAAGAVLTAALGRDRLRSTAGALLAGAFAAWLARGWLGNLGEAALFLAAVAVLSRALDSWRGVAIGAALLAAGAITHIAFGAVGTLILLAASAVMLVSARREAAGGAQLRSLAGRVAVASAGTGLGWLAIASAGGRVIDVDTSQDRFFRREGFHGLLRREYRQRLAGDSARGSAMLGAAIGLGGLGVPSLGRSASIGGTYLSAVFLAWGVMTAVGIAVLWKTGWAPPQRLLMFAFFLPLLAAMGFAAGWGRFGRLGRGVITLAALAFLGGSLVAWYSAEPRVRPSELAVANNAADAAERLDPGTPLVFLVDTEELAAAFHVTRFGNVIRMALPAERIDEMKLALGSPSDWLAGIAPSRDDFEYDAIAERYLQETRAVRDRAAVFVLRPFNEPGYEEAKGVGRELASGVVFLDGPEEAARRLEGSFIGNPTTPVGLAPLALVGFSLAALAVLGALGGGWAACGLAGADAESVVGTAPAAGFAVAVLGAFVTDRLGGSAGDAWALAATALLGALGYGAAAISRRSSRRGNAGAPAPR